MNVRNENPDEFTETQPTHPDRALESYQPIHLPRPTVPLSPQKHPPSQGSSRLPVIATGLLALVLVYFFLPFHTNILILGVDSGLNRGELGRTDTIVLTTISPLKPYIGMLSIPRDLWVKTWQRIQSRKTDHPGEF